MSTGPSSDNDPEVGPAPQPELVDWWVWGVRNLAGVVAELLMISRGFVVIFIVLKVVIWALNKDSGELYQAAAGVAGFFLVWAVATFLGRFAASRASPDPERWLGQWRRR